MLRAIATPLAALVLAFGLAACDDEEEVEMETEEGEVETEIEEGEVETETEPE